MSQQVHILNDEELKTIVVPHPHDDDEVEQQQTRYSRQSLDPSIFIDVEAWALRFGVIGITLGIFSAAIPQYIYTIPNSITFGMRATCFGEKCEGLDFSLLRSSLNCNGGCVDALDQFRLRWRAIEGFSWMGVAFALLLCGLLRVGYTREVRGTALGAPHVFICLLTLFSWGIALSVMGGTLSCGNKCFEYGASVICKLIAFAIVVLSLPLGLIAARFAKYREATARAAFALIILAAAFEMAGLLSNRWIFTTTANTNGVLNAKGVGLFQTCIDNSCSTNDFVDLLRPGSSFDCAGRTNGGLKSRLWTGAALHFAAAVFCLGLMLIAKFKVRGVPRPLLVATALICATVANAVIFDTFESWMFCGRSYCEVISRNANNTACAWGASAAFSICYNICLGILFICEIVQALYSCCRTDETDSEFILKTQAQQEIDDRDATKLQAEKAAADRQAAVLAAAQAEVLKAVQQRERQELAEKERRDREEADARADEEHEQEGFAAIALAAAASGVVIHGDTPPNDAEENDDEQQEKTSEHGHEVLSHEPIEKQAEEEVMIDVQQEQQQQHEPFDQQDSQEAEQEQHEKEKSQETEHEEEEDEHQDEKLQEAEIENEHNGKETEEDVDVAQEQETEEEEEVDVPQDQHENDDQTQEQVEVVQEQDQQQHHEPSVAEKVASGEYVTVKDRAKVFEARK